MPSPDRFRVPALLLAALAIPLAGCVEEEATDPGDASDSGDSSLDEVGIEGTATPDSPYNAAVGVTEDVSSVNLEMSVTNVGNESQNGEVTTDTGEEAIATASTVNVTVAVFAGDEEVFNETYALEHEGSNGTNTPKAVQVSEKFGQDVIDLALREDEPNRAIVLQVTTDEGVIAVNGALRVNFVL